MKRKKSGPVAPRLYEDSCPRRTGDPLSPCRQRWVFAHHESTDDRREGKALCRALTDEYRSLEFWHRHEPRCVDVEAVKVQRISRNRYEISAVLVAYPQPCLSKVLT